MFTAVLIVIATILGGCFGLPPSGNAHPRILAVVSRWESAMSMQSRSQLLAVVAPEVRVSIGQHSGQVSRERYTEIEEEAWRGKTFVSVRVWPVLGPITDDSAIVYGELVADYLDPEGSAYTWTADVEFEFVKKGSTWRIAVIRRTNERTEPAKSW